MAYTEESIKKAVNAATKSSNSTVANIAKSVQSAANKNASAAASAANKAISKKSSSSSSSSKKSSNVMSDNDKNAISIAQDAYRTAAAKGDTAGMEAAHKTAESIRAKYGYTGGADGSEYKSLTTGEPLWTGGTNADWANASYGSKGTSTDYGTFQSDIDKLTKAQKQAAVDQLKAAKTKALANLDVQEQNIKPTYEAARNQTSAASQQGARSFAEYLANRGLTNSGAAAQGEVNRLSNLNNNLGNLATAEANAYRDIANQRTAVENDYAANLANANNQIMQNYYTNLLNYNEQQRAYNQQLQQQALGQYSGDYQARINELLAQGYSPNSQEILQLQALRGQKLANNYANAYTYQNSLNNIASGNWSYNDLLATGMTNDQATNLYNKTVASAQAAQAQQDLTNQINLQKLANETAKTVYETNKPYNSTIYHVSSGGNNNSGLNYENIIKNADAYLKSLGINASDEELAQMLNG